MKDTMLAAVVTPERTLEVRSVPCLLYTSSLAQPGARAALLNMLISVDEVPALPGFCPSIAIWGGSDPLLPAGTRERLSALIPELEAHIIRPAGHFLTETHSRALRDYLRGWLKYVG